MPGPDTLTAESSTAALGGWSDPNLISYRPESFVTLEGGQVAVIGQADYSTGSSKLLAFEYAPDGSVIAVEPLAQFSTSAFTVAPEILPMADGGFATVWLKTAVSQPPGTPQQANNDGEFRIFDSAGALTSGSYGSPIDTNAVSGLWAMTEAHDVLEMNWTRTTATHAWRVSESVLHNGQMSTFAAQQDATVYPPYPHAYIVGPNQLQVDMSNYGFSYYPATTYRGQSAYPGVPAGAVSAIAGEALPNGQFLVGWTTADATYVGLFDPTAHAFAWYEPVNEGLTVARTALYLTPLPDGGFVLSVGSGAHQYQVFDSAGHGGGWRSADTSIVGVNGEGEAYGVGADADGHYFIRDYAIASGDATAPPAATGDVSLVASGSAVTLTSAAGWTSAAVGSNHVLTIGGHPFNQSAYLQTFDAAGAETGSPALFSQGIPALAALDGGFIQVTFPGGPPGEEIYNAAGDRVFVINQYTSGAPHFFGLTNGGYVVTADGVSSFGLFDASAHNVGWFERPADGPSMPEAHGLAGGGFVFTYAGSAHFDVFQANGQMLAMGDLGAAASGFAAGFAATADGGFIEAWLSPDGGQYGLATALTIQAFDAAGAPEIGPVVIGQDLDPWHTAIQVQAHADGSDAILWSQGGGVFGAEYAAGAAGPVYAAMAGDLSTTLVTELSDGRVGLTWQHDGEVWSELFDPGSGAVQRVELGLSSGDLSTIHALATADGGMAISWHDGGLVRGAVLEADGDVGPFATLPGDLLGADALGRAVTIHDDGQGHPVLQAFALSEGGLFWLG